MKKYNNKNNKTKNNNLVGNPRAVLMEDINDTLAVRLAQQSPRLPQRVHHVINKAHLIVVVVVCS